MKRVATLTAMSPRRFLLRTAGITGSSVAAQLPAILLVAWPLASADLAMLSAELTINSSVFGLLMAFVLELRERGREHRPAAIDFAQTCAAVVAVAVLAAMCAFTPAAIRFNMASTQAAMQLHLLWVNVFLGVVGVVYLSKRRESVAAELKRQHHERQWALARRRLADAQARAAQARVDPAILFDCLLSAKSAYAGHPARADQLLEALTTYLRAALAGSTDGTAGTHDPDHVVQTASALAALQRLQVETAAGATTPFERTDES